MFQLCLNIRNQASERRDGVNMQLGNVAARGWRAVMCYPCCVGVPADVVAASFGRVFMSDDFIDGVFLSDGVLSGMLPCPLGRVLGVETAGLSVEGLTGFGYGA